MSFQAYLDNLEAKTGKTPNELIAIAEQKGFDSERRPWTRDGARPCDQARPTNQPQARRKHRLAPRRVRHAPPRRSRQSMSRALAEALKSL